MSIFIKKKKFIFLITLIVVGKAIAAEPFPAGVYVGLGGGYNRNASQFIGGTTTNNFAVDNGIVPDTRKKDLNSFIATGFLGYLHIMKEYSITLGGEVFWTYLTGNQKFHLEGVDPALRTSFDSKFKPKQEYGFKIALGYLIDNINHVYGLLGFSNKNFNEKITSTFISGADEAQAAIFKNFSNTYFLMGIGFERAFNKIKYGIEGIYQIGNKKASLNHVLSASNLTHNPPGENYFVPGVRKLENSYTILFKISYSFDIFHE